MDRLDELIAFTAVVETGSFTAAAERLRANKSAVSRRVSSLERRLGAQLLRRTTRSLNLTDTGRRFYERAVGILDDLDEAESAVAQAHGALRGRLRVALPLTFGVLHMQKPIDAFGSRHPHVRFDLDLSDRRVDLLQEGIDVALRIGELEDSSLVARKLFRAKTVVCASPQYLDRYGHPQTPPDLADHDCLVYTNRREPERWSWIDERGESQTVSVRVRMAANSGDLLGHAAAGGLGIVMQPTFIAHRHIRQGTLVPILTDVAWPVSTAWAVYPPARNLSYRVRAFIEFLAAYFDGTPYWDEDCETAKTQPG